MTQPNITKEEFILALCHLDVAWVADCFYNQAEAHHFTANELKTEVEILFDTFRGGGDTKLEVHPGTCVSDECSHPDAEGYIFVGNHSRDFLNFVLHQKDNELQIQNCVKMEAVGSKIPTKGEHVYFNPLPSSFSVYRDEPKKLIRLNRICAEMASLCLLPQILSCDQIGDFLHANSHDYMDVFELNLRSVHSIELREFQKLYDALNFLYSAPANLDKQCNEALRDYKHFAPDDYAALNDWHLKHQGVHDWLDVCMDVKEWPDDVDWFILNERNLRIKKEHFTLCWEVWSKRG